MKSLVRASIAMMLAFGCAQPASFSIDLGRAAHALRTPAGFRRTTMALALAANAGDYATTRWDAATGRGCELNPLLVSTHCVLDVRKFGLVKGLVFAVLASEELIPHVVPQSYRLPLNIVGGIANIPVALMFGSLTANNWRVHGRLVAQGR
jgi:hypothetical protein